MDRGEVTLSLIFLNAVSKQQTMKTKAMNNTTVNMNLTPEEAIIIENIRAMQSPTSVSNMEAEMGNKLMQKYMAMDEDEFMEEYLEAVGDDVILDVLQDTLTPYQKWNAIWAAVECEHEVVYELFDSYVSLDKKRQLFFDTNDREELCVQLVDMIMDGDWTPRWDELIG